MTPPLFLLALLRPFFFYYHARGFRVCFPPWLFGFPHTPYRHALQTSIRAGTLRPDRLFPPMPIPYLPRFLLAVGLSLPPPPLPPCLRLSLDSPLVSDRAFCRGRFSSLFTPNAPYSLAGFLGPFPRVLRDVVDPVAFSPSCPGDVGFSCLPVGPALLGK